MGYSITHLLLVLAIILLLFGAKRIPEIMKELAKGFRSFKDGIEERIPPKKKQGPAKSKSTNHPHRHKKHKRQ